MLKRILVLLVPLVIIFLLFNGQLAYAANINVNTTDDELNSDGDCSLREAVQAANTDTAVDGCTSGSGTDTITLPAGTYTLSIAGVGEDANLTGDLDITSNLTISGAGATSSIVNGGAIDRVFEVGLGATAQINGVTIQNGSIIGFGGGIFNSGTLIINECTVDDNETTGPNLSGGGGGIFTQGVLTLTKSTVSNNTSQGRGAGIYNLDMGLNITNSTISGNTGLNGGGIFNRGTPPNVVNITNATIANNTATDNGGGVWNFGGTMNLRNTIVGVNSAATAADDCAGAITSLGYNLASDASCAFGGVGDLNSTNPMLGPLASNGGPTMTHELLAGSPALDTVPLSSCPLATDQRGVLRPQGAGCDIGAYEGPPTLPSECSGVIGNYNIIQGTSGNDNLNGTVNKDLIFAYGGNDKLTGGSGDDCLIGGEGDDRLKGGSGNDVLFGDEDEDDLDGGSGDDKMFGGLDNDKMDGGSGDDQLNGEGGDDDLRGGSKNDSLIGGLGLDEAEGGSGVDFCSAETMISCNP